MPIYLVDPGGGLDTAYSWMGAVYAPADGGTYPIPPELTEAVTKLKAYIAARQPKPPDPNGGTTNGGTTNGGTRRVQSTVITPQGNGNGAVTTPRAAAPVQTSTGQTPLTDLTTEDDLPNNFPGRAELVAAGHTTIGAVKQLIDEQALTGVTGIGPKTAPIIEQYMAAFGSE